jgi:molybdopterin-containing oxidoreductase family membrane subunit
MTTKSISASLSGIYRGVIEKQKTPSNAWFPIGMGIGVVLLSLLAYSMYNIYFVGHHVLGNNKEVPWGLFIVVYAIAISGIGLGHIASFGTVLGLKQFDVIAKRASFLAIIIIIPGMAAVMLEMTQPLHSIWIFFTPHFTSPLTFVAISIQIYLILIAAELFVMIKYGFNNLKLKILAISVFSVMPVVHSYHGAIFGLAMRDMWSGVYYSFFFLVSSIYASCAFFIVFTYLTYKATGKQISARLDKMLKTMGKIMLAFMILGAFFLYWKLTIAANFHKPSTEVLTSGPFKYNFMLEIALTYVIPILVIALTRFRTGWLTFAAFVSLIGLFFVRWNFVIGGQLTPYLGFLQFGNELGVSGSKFATYSPSITEITGALGLIGVLFVAYLLGIKYLPLGKDEQAEELQTADQSEFFCPKEFSCPKVRSKEKDSCGMHVREGLDERKLQA